MAKARFFLFKGLSKVGNSLFAFLSKCEEKDVFPKSSRWLKTTVLAGFITVIGTLSAASLISCHCYVTSSPAPVINSATVNPNPTQSSDSVSVEAFASFAEEDKNEGYTIESAEVTLNDFTKQMEATDGSFDEEEEELSARFYVGNIEPGSTKVSIEVRSEYSYDEPGFKELDLEITEAEEE
ncbi:hypothetical protein GF359_06480 [candidate division WOR-3 bacterium]|uniref:Uncharacterized protein n=1 Tax=candidate division WOR-3 bacterium TaxID=2052148 RepID=A0A9D5QEA2_UNCW3|nr:hypothetical protein [candidate division WOR-3 bacterium]MBD3364845.1 hypothetical protein [candidate division WOR-3 bacterium]